MNRRPSAAFLFSLVAHLAVGAALLYVLQLPYPLSRLYEDERVAQAPVERIGFITLPQGATETPGRRGGDGRPLRPTPPRELTAPSSVPSTLPPAPAARPVEEEGGTGPLVGGGGPTQGIRPSFVDKRLWVPPAPVVSAPRTPVERLDSALAFRVKKFQDSLTVAAQNRGPNPNDWTFQRGGKKYGIDSSYIQLGDFRIPTTVLALLPLNVQGNPIANERNRQMAAMRDEIVWQAQRAMNEEEFKDAVKRIRERKDRERAAERERDEKLLTGGASGRQ